MYIYTAAVHGNQHYNNESAQHGCRMQPSISFYVHKLNNYHRLRTYIIIYAQKFVMIIIVACKIIEQSWHENYFNDIL